MKAEPTKLLDLFVGLFVATLLIANISAQKLFDFFGVTFTAGIIIFPVSYILGDVLTEVYGYEKTRRVIWIGFSANLLAVAVFQASIALPPSPVWHLQREFETVLSTVPRTVIASLTGYLIGEFANSYVLARLKVLTSGRHLWIRTISSTIVGQTFDTATFAIIAFGGIMPLGVLAKVALSGYLFKVGYEVIITPLTYWVVAAVKKHEGIDTYDRATDFTPFKM